MAGADSSSPETFSAESLSDDARWMHRAIRLATNGRGTVEPNPMVGCVIVKAGRVIGEGYHQCFGGPHAEPVALAACVEDPAGATAYVTLEPCCHLDKKTPPCVPRLIAAKLQRVVVACRDPNPKVSGQGIAQLRSAGIIVDEGICQAESRQLNAAFFKLMQYKLPYVTLKWAQTADGKVAGPGGRRMQIGNAASAAAVHQLRGVSDAILVGINTVLNDDPLLTTRKPDPSRASRKLHRIVLDSHLRIPISSRLVKTAGESPVMVFCSESVMTEERKVVSSLQDAGVEVRALRSDGTGELAIGHLLQILGEKMLTHLIVEPGPTLAASFLRENLADRIWVFRSEKIVNDATAPAAVKLEYPVAGEADLPDGTAVDHLSEYLNPAGEVFYKLAPSVDFARLELSR